MNVLDRLDQFEKEGSTYVDYDMRNATVRKTSNIIISRSHLRALLDVARAAEALSDARSQPAINDMRDEIVGALSPLLKEIDEPSTG